MIASQIGLVYATYLLATASPGPSNMAIMATAMRDGRGPALAEHGERLLGGRLEPDRLERVVDAATSRPDRIAGWAALLGLVLVLVSTATH